MEDTTRTVERVLDAIRDLRQTYDEAIPIEMRIEVDGMGKGIFDHVRKEMRRRPDDYLNVGLVQIRSGGKPRKGERSPNRRSHYWFALRERFEQDDITLIADDKLQAQLVTIRYTE